MASVQDNKQVARRAFEALMARQLDGLGPLMTADCQLHQCGFLEPIPGSAILAGRFPGDGPVKDRQVRLERIIGEGDLVALHWWTSGRHVSPDSPESEGT